MDEDEVFTFVRKFVGSVGTLEVLIVMSRSGPRTWKPADLVRKLRSSDVAIAQAIGSLKAAELVHESECGCTFAPATPELAEIVADIEKLYATRPIALIQAIMSAPNEKLRIFSDAFKLKE